MSVTVQFTGHPQEVMAEMAYFISGNTSLVPAAPPPPPPVEPEAEAPVANAKAPTTFLLKDAGGDMHGTYTDEKTLVDDLLELIEQAEDLDALKALGDNNEDVAGKLKKAAGQKVVKAFRDKRAALEEAAKKAAEGNADSSGQPADSKPAATDASAGSSANADKKVLTVKAKPQGSAEVVDVPVPGPKDAATLDDVKDIVGLIMTVDGLALPAARSLLGKFDAARLSELKPHLFNVAYKTARNLLIVKAGGEPDPIDDEADPLA